MVKWRCESAASPAGGQGGDTWGCSDPAAGSGASGRQARRRLEGGCVPRQVRRAGKAASGPVAAVRHAGESAAAGVGAPRRVRRASGRPVGRVAAVRHAGESAAAGVGASRRVRRASGAVAGVLRWHCGESGVPAGRAFRKLNKKQHLSFGGRPKTLARDWSGQLEGLGGCESSLQPIAAGSSASAGRRPTFGLVVRSALRADLLKNIPASFLRKADGDRRHPHSGIAGAVM